MEKLKIVQEKKLSKNDFFLKYSKLKQNPDESQETFQNFLAHLYIELKYLAALQLPSQELFLKNKKILLPKKDKKKKKTLFLDLDETLVHLDENILLIRPYAKEFLEKISEKYEIFIFTAATYNYAELVTNYLDSNNTLIDGIISREKCIFTKNGNIIKDLSLIKNRNLRDIVLVDNLARCFGTSISNGVPIISFNGNKQDKELLFLLDVLEEMAEVEDCRIFLDEKYCLKEIMKDEIDWDI